MLYHASRISGLKRLEPHLSAHQMPYVYAIGSKLAAVLFGVPKDDFDLLMDLEGGKPILYECYPEALKNVYSSKAYSIYTEEETGFLAGMTGWEEELLCQCGAGRSGMGYLGQADLCVGKRRICHSFL